MTSKIPQNIEERICYVSRFVSTGTNDWFRVKKEILAVLAPKDRSYFSRRHKTSKKHFINEFELEVMKYWESVTKIKLEVDQEKLHTINDERPPRYWGLMKYNQDRHEE